MQTRRCSNCGKEELEYKMFSYNTGRIQWICCECYEQGRRNAKYREAIRDMRIKKDKKWKEK